MWPLLFRALRTYAPYITLPVAAVVGFVGYNFESIVSDKYTPYTESIKESRNDRLISEESLEKADRVASLTYKENVFGRNLSPSLQSSK